MTLELKNTMFQRPNTESGETGFFSFFKKPVPELPYKFREGLRIPNGIDEILLEFGNIYAYINDDGTLKSKWEDEHMQSIPLPFSIPLSWDRSERVTALYGHKKLAQVFSDLFTEIKMRGLDGTITSFGNCYNFRSKRTSHHLSAHSWGIAIDINNAVDYRGRMSEINPAVVEIFKSYGFTWGGDWGARHREPTHFQFCRGY